MITIKKGWECPKCGAIMAPFMPSCINCKPIPINPPGKCLICGEYHGGLSCPLLNPH